PPTAASTTAVVHTLSLHDALPILDEAHLDGAERLLEVAVAAVALVAEPLGLRAPVDVLVGLPDEDVYWGPETEWLGDERYSGDRDRKSTRLNSSHVAISYAVFCL